MSIWSRYRNGLHVQWICSDSFYTSIYKKKQSAPKQKQIQIREEKREKQEKNTKKINSLEKFELLKQNTTFSINKTNAK